MFNDIPTTEQNKYGHYFACLYSLIINSTGGADVTLTTNQNANSKCNGCVVWGKKPRAPHHKWTLPRRYISLLAFTERKVLFNNCNVSQCGATKSRRQMDQSSVLETLRDCSTTHVSQNVNQNVVEVIFHFSFGFSLPNSVLYGRSSRWSIICDKIC